MRSLPKSLIGGCVLARLALLALLTWLPGCGEDSATDPGTARADPSRPSVLLVTIDTLRADRVGAYGHAAAFTPTLDGLARRGVTFERAWSPAPITLTSHTSLLTGTWPLAHGVRDNALYAVSAESELVSEVLGRAGWRTAAFVGSFVLEPRFGLDQGFEVYDSPLSRDLSRVSEQRQERPAAEVVDAARAWLSSLGPDEPFFLWIHMNEPHAPYTPPPPFDTQLADAYDGEIAAADHQLGRLLEALAAAGQDENLLIVVTSDHGEALGEHGEPSHGLLLHDATLRVPLIVVWPEGRLSDGAIPDGAIPDGEDGNRRSLAPVSLVDLAGTILQTCGLTPDALPDSSAPTLQAALADEASAAERPIYIETFIPYHKHRWHPLTGVVLRGHKLVDSPRPELFDLDADPGENQDLASAEPDVLAALRGALDQLRTDHPPLGWAADRMLSDDERDQLAELGYAGTAAGAATLHADLPLPRDRIGDVVLEQRAASLLLAGRDQLVASRTSGDPADREAALAQLAEARDLLVIWRQLYPANPKAAWDLGEVLMWMQDYEAAAEALEQHALAVPSSTRTRYNLALCYARMGEPVWAHAEMVKAVVIDDQADAAYLWLASQAEQAGDFGVAVGWLDALLSVWTAPARDFDGLSRQRRRLAVAMAAAGQSRVTPELPGVGSDLTPAGISAASR